MNAVHSISSAYGKRLLVVTLAVGLALGWAGSAVGAETITDENVAAAVTAARTVEDHQALAAYFTTKSKQALAEVEKHKTMASALGKGKQAGSWEAHCHSLMRTYQEQAKDYTALAKEQEALAKGMQMQHEK